MTVNVDWGTAETASSAAYQAYLGAGYSLIPEDDYERFAKDATDLIADMTLNADSTGYEVEIATATYRGADALYQAMTMFASEHMGSYSYSLSEPRTTRDARAAILRTLGPTGLCYRGIEPS